MLRILKPRSIGFGLLLLLAGAMSSRATAQDAEARGIGIRPPGSIPPGYPGGRPPAHRWQLGVVVKNSTTGALIKDVVKGSPAAAAKLQENDRILAVGGMQVGYIDDEIVDLGDALSQRVGRDGQVTLLVFTNRGTLTPVPITFDARSNELQGVAVYKGNLKLGRDAILNVRLLDVTFNHWNGVAVAQTSLPKASRTPYDFQFPYEPRKLFPNHKYAFEAEVIDQGRTVLKTRELVPYDGQSPKFAVILHPPGPGNSNPGFPGFPGPGFPGGSGGPGPGRPPGGPRPFAAREADDVAAAPTPGDQVRGWYQEYLGREPTAQEWNTWRNHLARGQSLSDIQAALLGSTEYYDRNQNDDDQYVRGVYRAANNADPTPEQAKDLRQKYNQSNGVRASFVEQLLKATRKPAAGSPSSAPPTKREL